MSEIVSLILPIYNEGHIIESVVQSLLAQELPGFELELVLIDGMSTDGSWEILQRLAAGDQRIHILRNEKRRTPFAFNLGLQVARGEYICIFGAHCTYDKDYIARCIQEAELHGAIGCSGRVVTRPVDDSLQAQLVAWAISHPFGSSSRSFRTQKQGFVDSIPYPVYKKRPLLELGGYNEVLLRNQDNDMNYRLRRSGYKLYCTWKTNCYYHGRSSVWKLLKYAFNTGSWNAISLKVNPRSLNLRHHIPTIFAAETLLGVGLAIFGWIFGNSWVIVLSNVVLLTVALHLVIGTLVSLRILSRSGKIAGLLMPFVFLFFHLAYGSGTLWGFLSAKANDG